MDAFPCEPEISRSQTFTIVVDLRREITVGSEKFAKRKKKRYFPNIPRAELPSQKQTVMNKKHKSHAVKVSPHMKI